jgi:A/G-specific adenine glycosylase
MGALAVEAAEVSLPEDWVWADQAGLRSTYAVPSAFQRFAKTVEQSFQGV